MIADSGLRTAKQESAIRNPESDTALYLDDEPPPALHIIPVHTIDVGAAAAALQHPWHEPAGDVGRQVADDVATRRVHPDPRIVGTWGIGNEDEAIARMQAVNDFRTLAKNGAVHRRAKVIVVRWIWRWFHPLAPSRPL